MRDRIVIVAPNWLGDAVMALPAVADVRRAFPDGCLAVAARQSVADLYPLVAGIDDVVRLGWDGRWWRRGAFGRDVATLAMNAFDVALLLPNSFSTARMVRRAGIRQRWGYAADGRSWLLTRAVPRPREECHQGEYYQQLVAALGIANGPLEPAIAVPPATVEKARRLLAGEGHPEGSPIVVLAPGAAYGKAKQWIPAHVATLIDRLARERSATCVMVGSRADSRTGAAVRSALRGVRPIDLIGRTTLETLAGVLACANACVSNDSGAMHLAAAVGAPLVSIFGSTNERVTGPLARSGRRAEVLTHHVWCRPCMLRECPIDHRCMTRITPERVFGVVSDMLASGGDGPEGPSLRKALA
jgi:heptosyltransferase-2